MGCSVPDTRPLFSVPDEHAQRIGQDLADAVKVMLDHAFAAVLSLPGDPAERRNDALSLVSGLSAMVGVQLVGRLVQFKAVPLEVALPIAVKDIGHRIQVTVSLLKPAGHA